MEYKNTNMIHLYIDKTKYKLIFHLILLFLQINHNKIKCIIGKKIYIISIISFTFKNFMICNFINISYYFTLIMSLHKVILRIYKIGTPQMVILLNSIAKTKFEAIWHTSIEIFNKEYYFGDRIYISEPNKTSHGVPYKIFELGDTSISKEEFDMFLNNISEQFGPKTYNILLNNCNHFSNICSLFLCDKPIPQYILDVHEMSYKCEEVRKFSSLIFPDTN